MERREVDRRWRLEWWGFEERVDMTRMGGDGTGEKKRKNTEVPGELRLRMRRH